MQDVFGQSNWMYATWEGHLDVTQCTLARTLSVRLKEATSQVISVGAVLQVPFFWATRL